jgi:hypothetical protein
MIHQPEIDHRHLIGTGALEHQATVERHPAIEDRAVAVHGSIVRPVPPTGRYAQPKTRAGESRAGETRAGET